jgi:uncharacterized lipoprotein YehR (DUF1307 family)
MKPLALLSLAVIAVMVWMLSGCSQYKFTGGLSYQGQYGDYSVTSDGKTIATSVKLKDPKGYAK